ncbi:hypothetical protein Plhal703r1_c03g0019911 [Plasmopara halstedii]
MYIQLAPLINDRNEKVRADFGALLIRVKSIRNLHFYDIVPVNDLLYRMVEDRDSPLACKQLVSLFLNSYFPQSVGGSSQVARCLALVKKNPEAAMVFYANVVEHVSVGSVCKLAALLLRCSLNFVSKRLKQTQESEDDDVEDEEDDEEGGFSVVGQVVVLEIIANVLHSVNVKVFGDNRYAECKTFLREQLNVNSLEALLLAYSKDRPYDQEALSSIWRIIGYLGDLAEENLLERLVGNFMELNATSNRKLLESMVNCMVQWDRLPLLTSKLAKFLHLWRKNKLRIDTDGFKSKKSTALKLNPVVVLGTIEYIFQLPTVKNLNTLLQPVVEALNKCVEPVLEYEVDEVKEAYMASPFLIIRLIEIYARGLVMAECAHVKDETSLLVEKSTKRLKKNDDLRDLQPSEFFTPPMPLNPLLCWLAQLMLHFRNEVEVGDVSKRGKKRRRNKNTDEVQPAPLKEMLNRWRNLFSFVSLMAAESAAFALERTHWLQNGPAADFIDAYTDTLSDTLQKMKFSERTVFYQAGQLLHLLGSARIQALSSTKTSLVSSLEHWISKLQQALLSAHKKYQEMCDDIWPTISASFNEQCALKESETVV